MTPRPYLLPADAMVDDRIRRSVERDYERFARSGLPKSLEAYIAEEYGIDLSAEYAGLPLRNPWGKASGQLSMTSGQVAEDVEAGLAFVVLKTVIAQDETGGQTMKAWAVKESRMAAQRIVGGSGEPGWTIDWKGRGWWQSFDEYLDLIRESQRIARGSGTLIVPSCKFHLPTPDEAQWKVEEYRHTAPRLLEAWRDQAEDPTQPMPLEKDFSPTLAGSDRSTERTNILQWLRTVPRLIREAVSETAVSETEEPGGRSDGGKSEQRGGKSGARGQSSDRRASPELSSSITPSLLSPRPVLPPPPLRIGLKIFNALFDDEFQLDMLREIHRPGPGRPDFFVYGNRLFDPDRQFDGQRGIAYGGPDLSDRNLRVLGRFQDYLAPREHTRGPAEYTRGGEPGARSQESGISRGRIRNLDEIPAPLPWSATGNITTGKMALEYALRGASSFQLHTFFQLPSDQYHMTGGSKSEKALHELYFHPATGFILWMRQLAAALNLPRDPIRFRDVVGKAQRLPADAKRVDS